MEGGALAYLRDGDVIRLDADAGVMEVKVDAAELMRRPAAAKSPDGFGLGRELFAHMRRAVGPAEAGASVLF
jgi:phosphogluconate dehydratase